MKVLYIGNKINSAKSGADQVNKRNQFLLEQIASVRYLSTIDRKSFKFQLSVGDELLKDLRELLLTELFDFVFVEQSTLGRVCYYLKKQFPKVRIILFFHNIELQYAREYFKTAGIRALPFYLSIKVWEKVGCMYSDGLITLNSRDTFLLKHIYGKDSHLELPTSMADKFDMNKALFYQNQIIAHKTNVIDYLFVGVAFFANIEGVQWFIDNVLPFVPGQLYIVGKGMDKVAFKNLNKRVHIFGFVDDLSEFYYRSRIIVSPINVGGGMKTKTAEALMYGKTIVGTPEAFMGYEIDSTVGVVCKNPKEFVSAIKNLDDSTLINEQSRCVFLEKYSNQVLLERFNDFLKNWEN